MPATDSIASTAIHATAVAAAAQCMRYLSVICLAFIYIYFFTVFYLFSFSQLILLIRKMCRVLSHAVPNQLAATLLNSISLHFFVRLKSFLLKFYFIRGLNRFTRPILVNWL